MVSAELQIGVKAMPQALCGCRNDLLLELRVCGEVKKGLALRENMLKRDGGAESSKSRPPAVGRPGDELGTVEPERPRTVPEQGRAR